MQWKTLAGRLKDHLDTRKHGGGIKKLKVLLIGKGSAIKNGTGLKRERKMKTKLPGKGYLW